jgi:histidine triad (HIT) family protein
LDCIFCKIANKEIASEIVYEDDDILVFRDVNPQAPVHLLAIPKRHIDSLMEIDKIESNVLKKIFTIISKLSKEFNIDKSGFRVVSNVGEGAGQSVKHLHFHILGGRKFNWPPG